MKRTITVSEGNVDVCLVDFFPDNSEDSQELLRKDEERRKGKADRRLPKAVSSIAKGGVIICVTFLMLKEDAEREIFAGNAVSAAVH